MTCSASRQVVFFNVLQYGVQAYPFLFLYLHNYHLLVGIFLFIIFTFDHLSIQWWVVVFLCIFLLDCPAFIPIHLCLLDNSCVYLIFCLVRHSHIKHGSWHFSPFGAGPIHYVVHIRFCAAFSVANILPI